MKEYIKTFFYTLALIGIFDMIIQDGTSGEIKIIQTVLKFLTGGA